MNNFIVGQVTPDMLTHITYGTYILFGALTALGAGFVWFFVPETKRLTLEEMVRATLLNPQLHPNVSPLTTSPVGHHLRLGGHRPSRL